MDEPGFRDGDLSDPAAVRGFRILFGISISYQRSDTSQYF